MKEKKSMNTLEISFILIIGFSLIFIIFTAYTKIEIAESELEIEEEKEIFVECKEGQTKECITTQGCDGLKHCKNGKWTTCFKNPVICVPGSSTSCALSPCISGIKICNECGTGWRECRPR